MSSASTNSTHTTSSAVQFALEDVLVMLCEREAEAEICSALLGEAEANMSLNSAPARRSAKALLSTLHGRVADAELEGLYLRSTLLDLAMRGKALWITECLHGRRTNG